MKGAGEANWLNPESPWTYDQLGGILVEVTTYPDGMNMLWFVDPDTTCLRKMRPWRTPESVHRNTYPAHRSFGYCLMPKGHRGRCSTVVFWCDGCGKARRGEPTYRDQEAGVGFCWMCMNGKDRPRKKVMPVATISDEDLALLRSYDFERGTIWDAASLLPTVISLREQGLIEPVSYHEASDTYRPDPDGKAHRLTDRGAWVLEANTTGREV